MKSAAVPEGKRFALPDCERGWHRFKTSPLADGRLAILYVSKDINAAFARRASGEFVKNPFELAKSASARIHTFDGASSEVAVTFDLLRPFPLFDRLPDGRWLVVNSRRADEIDDARIVGNENQIFGNVRLGDGIEHIQIGSDATVWIGWFDEGVFGNDDWKFADRRWPPSSSGVAAFSLDGSLLCEAPPSEFGGIADCYALNVVGSTAWACTYTDFPILKLDSHGRSTYFSTGLAGTQALAVDGDFVLAAGGYEKHSIPFNIFRIGNEKAEKVKTSILGMPEAGTLTKASFAGRGKWLHHVVGNEWRRWEVRDFVDADIGR